jgi:hypothetical protein
MAERNLFLQIRVSESERDQIRADAKKMGMVMASWIRFRLLNPAVQFTIERPKPKRSRKGR